MPAPSPAAAAPAVLSLRPALGVALDVVQLAKPRLATLVLCTAAGGMWLAPGPRTPLGAAALLLGTAMVVGAANALNNWLERESDARMRRTRNRPLPAGRVEPWVALALGLGLPAVALPALAFLTNGLTALLAGVALVSYAGVYTPLKRRSPLALFVGAIPGAIPPLLGWTAVTGRLDLPGLSLFALLYAWQLPHFLAISVYLREDYARGGLRMFAGVYGERAALRANFLASAALLPASLALVPLGLAGPAYGLAAAALGTGLATYAFTGLSAREPARWARRFFLSTLGYLTLLLAALLVWAR